jgi:FkbM family methyltransferase
MEKCIASWKIHHPNFRIKEWNENNSPITENKFISQAFKTKNWAFVSDYVRFWVLQKYGGIYLDTDMYILKSLEPLCSERCFLGSERTEYVSCGIIGAISGHWYLKECLDVYETIHFNEKTKHPSSPVVITNILKDKGCIFKDKKLKFEDISIYPPSFFYPLNFKHNKNEIEEAFKGTKAFSVHLWAASWHNEWQHFMKGEKKKAFNTIKEKINFKYVFNLKNWLKLFYYSSNLNKVRYSFNSLCIPKLLKTTAYPEFLLKTINYHTLLKSIPSNKAFNNSKKYFNRLGVHYNLPINEHNAWRTFFLLYTKGTFDLFKMVKNKFTIVDIGANIGFYSLSMAKNVPDGKVYSFEPEKKNYRILSEQIKINRFKNIVPYNIALGKVCKKTQLEHFGNKDNFGTYRINLEKQKDSPYISMSTLDMFYKNNEISRLDILKIDTEGFEFEIISGAINTIHKYKPIIFIEINDSFLKHYGSSAKILIKVLSDWGYIISNADTKELITEYTYLEYCQFDATCFHSNAII